MQINKNSEVRLTDIKISARQVKNLPNLNQILELTQQNETCRVENPVQENEQQDSSSSCFSKAIKCCRRLLFRVCARDKLTEVDVNESQMSHLIERLRTKKDGFTVVLPPQKQPKKTLILDLDQTLIYTVLKKVDHFDFQAQIPINGKVTKAYTIKRFGLDAFLFQMSKIFEIVVFTAGQKKYADIILNKIDPKGWISHRLYRQHCILVNKTYYLKNLKILGRSMGNCIMVDDNRMGGVLQPDNFYRIEAFSGSQKDRKLVRLAGFLKYLNGVSDVRPVTGYRKKFDHRQIRLKQNSFLKDSTIEEKKKMYRHKKTNSQIESLAQKDSNRQNVYEQEEETNNQIIIPR